MSMSDPVPQVYFNRLCDICDLYELTIGVRVLEQALKSNGYKSRLGIIVWKKENHVVFNKQLKYNSPKFDALAMKTIQDLAKRGFDAQDDVPEGV